MQTHGCDISLITSRKTWELFASEVNGPVVVDFETNGHPIWAPDFKVIGIGLAFYVAGNLRGFYIPVFESEQIAPKQFKLVKSRAESGLVRDVVNWLNGKNVIAHNISFDGCILKQLEVKCNFFYDTMIGLHLLLPGETYVPKKDHTGQFIRNPKTGKFQMERRSLRLKWAMQNILGWPETNEKEVNDFIRKNKHKKGQDLWICPLDLIWSYGALDAIATFRLYESQITEMKELNSNQIMRYLLDYCDLLCDQTLQGTNFDRESAFIYASQLEKDIATAQETFMKMSEDKIIACGIVNFNINSNKHLVKLFFDDSGFAYTPISFTDNGDPEITKDTLRAYGRPGACLAAYKTKSKLKQFLDSYIEHSTDGKIHIQSNVCGQLSGRVSQRDPSLLQMPRRDSRMMQLFKAEPGWSIIQNDFNSLEPSVLTAFSRDKVLRDIYTNSDPNKNFDVYLELGLRMNFLIDGEKCKDLVSRYYSSGMPTQEFGEAKKMLKKIREKLKVVQLALGYAGTEMTLMETLKIPYDDATLIYKDYWETFKGVRLFENFIKERLKQGPLYTFHGRPLKIAPNRHKDALNTLIQASGHDILMQMNLEVLKEIKSRGIQMKPYIADFHDEAIYTFRNDYSDEALDILNTAISKTNIHLKSTGWFDFELKAPPQVVKRRPYWALKDLSEIEK